MRVMSGETDKLTRPAAWPFHTGEMVRSLLQNASSRMATRSRPRASRT